MNFYSDSLSGLDAVGSRGMPVRLAAMPHALSAGGRGLNPLVQAAGPVLALIAPLRLTADAPDLALLQHRLLDALRQFAVDARDQRISADTVVLARYLLCTLLDETIAGTSWGSGMWGAHSLLIALHNEAWGGEKVFVILQRLSQDARANLDMLELVAVCLAMGLEGRYRVIDGGRQQFSLLRERLARLIVWQRGHPVFELSPRWHGAADPTRGRPRRVPLWAAALGAGLLLALMLTLAWRLSRATEQVQAQLGRIRVVAQQRVAPVSVCGAPARLSCLLAADIDRGRLSVSELGGGATITLRGDGVFASGSAEIPRDMLPLLSRIGEALRTVPGKVLVVGHADDQQLPGTVQLSNYDLSLARARAVRALLAEYSAAPSRYDSEGRGDSEPLAPNDSAANRARNRRVDIVVLPPGGASVAAPGR